MLGRSEALGTAPAAGRVFAVCVALLLLVGVTFVPSLGSEFIDYDSPEYVAEQPVISQGMTWEGVAWVWTHEHVGNWHPVTGLAHMLDAELFGVTSAWPHRLVNVLWHALNTLLVLLLIVRTTGALWRGAFVAALFAVHPLHVESVLWVAERKDVLSTALGLGATWFWLRWIERQGDPTGPSRSSYALAFVLFALGLLAKPMLVTWPFVLLLLDVWPLGRRKGDDARSWRALVVEKVPLMALSFAVSIVTFVVQRGSGAMNDAQRVGLGARVANAVLGYATYLRRALWPVDLAVLYPHPALPGESSLSMLHVALAAGVLIAISLLVWRSRALWARVFWLGYLGTLVPVIGLVQVGEQATADRYTYVPLLGVFGLVAWTAGVFVERRGATVRLALGAAGLLLVSVAAWQTTRQAALWRDTETLLEHSLRVAPESSTLHYNLARWLRREGRVDEAVGHYRRALEIEPTFASAQVNLGVALQLQGRAEEAAASYRAALALEPNATAHHNLAMLLRGVDLDRAIVHHTECLRLQPDSADAYNALAAAWMMKGNLSEARRLLERALELEPAHAEAGENLARVRAALGGQ